MNFQNIDINKLNISNQNVRKNLREIEEETNIDSLANDIKQYGLINPISVKKINNKFEIYAGQRRFLACKN